MESLPTAECGKLFCRLGCVCDSLENAHNQSILEHCSQAECMFQCVCGYQEGNPCSRRVVSSLLESQKRRVERLSECHLVVSPTRRQSYESPSNFSLLSSPLSPQIPPENSSVVEPESQQMEHQQSPEPEIPEPPEAIEEEEATPRPAVDTAEILNAIEQKRKEVDEKMSKIQDNLNRMMSDTNKQQTAPISWKRPVVSPSSDRSSDFETLDRIFLLLQSIGISSALGTSAPLTKPPEIQRLEPIASTSDAVRRNRIFPPPATIAAKRRSTKSKLFSAFRNRLQKQRKHWTSKGLRPLVFTKTFGRRKIISSDGPAEEVSVPTSSDLLSATPQEASEKFVFPNIVTAEVISVQSNGNAATLKIILEELTGGNRVNMLLPLPNVDDRWVLVALDHMPQCGFQIPGLSVFIPGDVLGCAASTAVERKVRVCFPVRFQLINKETTVKPGLGVYGNPQLPRHVFVGPFPAKHFEKCSLQTYMMLITTTKPVPPETRSEPTASAENVQQNVSEPSTKTPTAENPPSACGHFNPDVILKKYSVKNVKCTIQKEFKSKTNNLSKDSNSNVCRQNEIQGEEGRARRSKRTKSPNNSIQRQVMK